MIRKIILIVAAAIMLAGCQTTEPTVVTTTKYKIIIPADAMYKCPKIGNLPDPDTLTDLQIAHLLEKLSENNAICRASIEQVKIFLKKSKAQFER